MITRFRRTVKAPQLEKLDERKRGVWVHAEAPTSEELEALADEFELEHSLLVDGLDMYEVPRLEIEDGIVYVFIRFPVDNEEIQSTTSMLIAVGSDFILTLSPTHPPFIDRFLETRVEFFTTQKVKFLLQLLQEINRSYTNSLTRIRRLVHRRRVNPDKVTDKDIYQFVSFESTLNDFISALTPNDAILRTLLSGSGLRLYEEDKELVEDIQLANAQLIESGKSNLKTIVNIREAYSVIATNQLNKVIKLLTSLTILLTIPTIITSFYGMNVPLPLENSPNAVLIITGIIIAASGILLGIFAHNRWL